MDLHRKMPEIVKEALWQANKRAMRLAELTNEARQHAPAPQRERKQPAMPRLREPNEKVSD